MKLRQFFFYVGFMTVWNDMPIPRFKESFALNFFQTMPVQFAFFCAYGIGSLIHEQILSHNLLSGVLYCISRVEQTQPDI